MTARLRILRWLFRRGKRLVWAKQWHLARRCFEQLLRLSERGSGVWQLAQVYLARIAERLGERATARGHIRELLRCQPGDARWHYRLGRLWRKEGRPTGWQRALRHLRTAVKRCPDRAAYWAEFGRCLADAGKPQAALCALRRAWTLAPGSLRYLAWLLELLLACDRHAEAEQIVQQARFLHHRRTVFESLHCRCRFHILAARNRSQELGPPILLPFLRFTASPHSVSSPRPNSCSSAPSPVRQAGESQSGDGQPVGSTESVGNPSAIQDATHEPLPGSPQSWPTIIRMDLPQSSLPSPVQFRRRG